MYDGTEYVDVFDAGHVFDGEDWYEAFEEDLDDLEEFEDDIDEELVELADAMADTFGALTPAEGFNIGKALGTIGKGATQVLGDPTVRQIAATAAPIAGGALGTVAGGPVGTAVGTSLGSAAGKALAPKPAPAPSPSLPVASAPPTPAPPKQPASKGSAAATKALVMSQQPDALKCLLALALGQKGSSNVNGIPVGAMMNMLAATYKKAAEDADELLYASEAVPSYLLDADGNLTADPAAPSERADALYAALIDRENEYLADAGLA